MSWEALGWLNIFQVQVSVPEWISDFTLYREAQWWRWHEPPYSREEGPGWRHSVSLWAPCLNDTGSMHSTQEQNENAGEKWRLALVCGIRARCQSTPETLKEKDNRPEGYRPQKIAETLHLGGWGRKSKGLEPVWTTKGNFTSKTKQSTRKRINNGKDTVRKPPCWEKWSAHEGPISYCGGLMTLAACVWNPEACGQ